MPDDPAFLLHVAVRDAALALEDAGRLAAEDPNLLLQEQAALRDVVNLATALFVKTLNAETITVEAA